MENKLDKVKFTGRVFVLGCKKQAADSNTLGMATVVGLAQGLKYKGNFKLGIETGLAVFGVVCVSNGIKCVIQNWDVISAY